MSEQLGLFAERMREGLLAASVAIGLEVMGELVEAEVSELAGPKGKHDPGRSAYRHGSEAGRVTLGGRRVPVRRPRVRTVADEGGGEREVRLESYDTFASVDLLAEQMVASMLAGLSGRRYQRALEPVGEQVEASASGTSQSSVSRRFIAATAERLAAFRSRPLDGERWLIVFVDGFDFAGHTMVGALGVTAEGTKVPLGVVEGSTENAAVVRGLISEPARPRPRRLAGRAVRARRRQGARQGDPGGVRRAGRDRPLPTPQGTERPRPPPRGRAAVGAPQAPRGLGEPRRRPRPKRRSLRSPASSRRSTRTPPASLREGLADTLTVTRLGITGSLLKTVMSTNPMESMIEIVREHARNVKHWQNGDMRLRWAAAGMLTAQAQFRRVKGYRQLPMLAAALTRAVGAETPTTIAVSA